MKNIDLNQIKVVGRLGSNNNKETGSGGEQLVDQNHREPSQNKQTSQQNTKFYFDEDFLIFNKNNDNNSKGKSEQQQPQEQKQSLFENIFAKNNRSELTFITSYLASTQERKEQIKLKFVGLDGEKSGGEKSDFIFVKDSNNKFVGIANRNFDCENENDPNNFLIIVNKKGLKTEISKEYLKLNDAELTKFLGCLGVVRENVVQDGSNNSENNDKKVSSTDENNEFLNDNQSKLYLTISSTLGNQDEQNLVTADSNQKLVLNQVETASNNLSETNSDKKTTPENEITVSSANNLKTNEAVKQDRDVDILDAVAKAVILYNGNNRLGLRQTGEITLEGKNLEIKFANGSSLNLDENIKNRAINNFKYLFQKACQEKSITVKESNEVLTFGKLEDVEKEHVSQNWQQKIETMKKANQQTL